MNEIQPYQESKLPDEVSIEDLNRWTVEYQKFLCSMIRFPNDAARPVSHQEHEDAVLKSLDYMILIQQLVHRVVELQNKVSYLEQAVFNAIELNKALQKDNLELANAIRTIDVK